MDVVQNTKTSSAYVRICHMQSLSWTLLGQCQICAKLSCRITRQIKLNHLSRLNPSRPVTSRPILSRPNPSRHVPTCPVSSQPAQPVPCISARNSSRHSQPSIDIHASKWIVYEFLIATHNRQQTCFKIDVQSTRLMTRASQTGIKLCTHGCIRHSQPSTNTL